MKNKVQRYLYRKLKFENYWNQLRWLWYIYVTYEPIAL